MNWSRPTIRHPRTATGWFARLRSREISPAERARFRRWLEADPRNREDFRRREELWQLLGAVVRDGRLAEETRQAVSRPPPGRSARARLGRWSAVAAGLALASISGWWSVELAGVRDVQTAVGEQQRVVLPDGSHITVNTASRLRIDYRFGRRRIRLEQGEALFDVAHDAAHPFVVQTAQALVTALGTEFAVEQSAQGIEVNVLEGRVRAEAPRAGERSSPSIVLAVGQAGLLSPRDREWTQGRADSARIRAWQAERLEFQGAALEAVVAEFNRYSNMQLVLEDRRLAPLQVSGVFRIGHTASLVRALVEVYPIQAYWESNRVVLRYAPRPGTPARNLARGEDLRGSPLGNAQPHVPGTGE